MKNNWVRPLVGRHLAIPAGLLLLMVGCGAPDRSEIRYPKMSFLSPSATGQYQRLTIFDPVAHDTGGDPEVLPADLPKIYLRLDGKTVLFIPDVTHEVALQHQLVRTEEMGPRELLPRKAYANFYPSGAVMWWFGEINGQQDDAVEIAAHLDGPFYRFPLTREQIVEMFGKPTDEFARDYPQAY